MFKRIGIGILGLLLIGSLAFGGGLDYITSITHTSKLDVSDGNITNVGDISLDSITSDDGTTIIMNDDVHIGADDAIETLEIHDAGTLKFWDDSDDTSVTLGPVTNGTTTLGITGSLDMSGNITVDGISTFTGVVSTAGKNEFGGVTDWGTGGTGVLINGDGWDWASQTVARVNSNINDAASAACYNALTVTANQTGSNSFIANWNELYIKGALTLTDSDNYIGVWGNIEFDAAATFPATGNIVAGLHSSITTPANIDMTCPVIGVSADCAMNATGIFTSHSSAFGCKKKSGRDWDYGLYLADVTTDIRLHLGATILNEAPGSYMAGGGIVMDETISAADAGWYYGIRSNPIATASQGGGGEGWGGLSVYPTVTGDDVIIETFNVLEVGVDAKNTRGGGNYLRMMYIVADLGSNTWTESYGIDLYNAGSGGWTSGIRYSGPFDIGLDMTLGTSITTGIDLGDNCTTGIDIGAATTGIYLTNVTTAMSAGDANITNVGDIALDSISADDAGSGTIKIDNILRARKFTIGHADLTDADTSEDEALFTLPAGGMVQDVYAYVTTQFTGGAVSAATVAIGTTDADLLAEEHSVLAAAGWILEGQSATDKGTGLYEPTDKTRINYIVTTATDLIAEFTTTDGNCADFTAGSIDIYILYLCAE